MAGEDRGRVASVCAGPRTGLSCSVVAAVLGLGHGLSLCPRGETHEDTRSEEHTTSRG